MSEIRDMSEVGEPPEPADNLAVSLDPAAAGPLFSVRLREHTKDVHREAERTGFLADLLRGRADRTGYAIFLRNLLPAYTAIEGALDANMTTPVVAVFAQPRFRRRAALESDLARLEGDGDASPRPVSPEALAYADAIRQAARESPFGLLAHAYARYLGDLSGGQILKPLLARSLSLDASALAFYDFPAIADLNAAKRDLRDALDMIPPHGPAASLVIGEAIGAFRHNIAVSKAVQSMLV